MSSSREVLTLVVTRTGRQPETYGSMKCYLSIRIMLLRGISGHGVCLLLFYVLATSKVISGRLPTYDSAHSWRLYSVAPLENQASSTMTWYPTQSYYPDTKCFPYSNNAKCLARKWHVSILKLLVWFNQGSNRRASDSTISQNGRRTLYSFGSWCQ